MESQGTGPQGVETPVSPQPPRKWTIGKIGFLLAVLGGLDFLAVAIIKPG